MLMNRTFDQFVYDYFQTLKNNRVKDAMAYAIKNGKHFRPKLLLSVIKGFELEETRGYHAALALEMIHSYSLIHDDLPCMDDDDYRRGKPSTHKAFGENIAVLAGDGLLTEAFNVVTHDKLLSDSQKVAIIHELSLLAGVGGMIHGQYLDLKYENSESISQDILNEIDDYKTGCLFKCSLLLPMIIVGDEKNRSFYEELGIKIGRLFQIQDDLFDIIKTSEEMGKPTHSDTKNNKATALSLMNQKEIETTLNKLFKETYALLDVQSFDTSYLRAIIHNIEER